MRRIDELFAIEREINGKPPDVRRAVRQERSKPLVTALDAYMREQFRRLSPKNDVAKAIGYMLTRWPSFTASSTTAGSIASWIAVSFFEPAEVVTLCLSPPVPFCMSSDR